MELLRGERLEIEDPSQRDAALDKIQCAATQLCYTCYKVYVTLPDSNVLDGNDPVTLKYTVNCYILFESYMSLRCRINLIPNKFI